MSVDLRPSLTDAASKQDAQTINAGFLLNGNDCQRCIQLLRPKKYVT
ncbi:hypothetical protein [Spirosoma pomorum]